ncbi:MULTISPECIES: universal stress protein [Pseudomonas]|uniref:universal stress protein n=1 Tax=Pseudomonas TaxID=286 RepID=UPI000CA19B21|nr:MULTISPECIES: universal stress protein [Pseudomonas]AUM70334.1 universal stress protein [Pseudomonas fluorescens]MCD9116946.1 universal stress protein [Pseudomonas bijieensis]MDP9782168.1 universal stress protein E [Pseudomonas fluorescens]
MSQTQRLLLLAPDAMIRTPAFDRATELALALDLPLHIVAIDYLDLLSVAGLFAPEQVKQAREGYLETHRHWLWQQAELARRHGAEVTCEVVWGKDPYQALQHYIKEMPLALIIKDAQPEPAMKRIFFTPLDWRLLRDCPVPVHLVTDARHPRPRRILAIVDVLRSEDQDLVFNDRIVDAAVKLAEQCNAQVELLHAFDWTAVYASDMGIGALPLATGLYEALGEAQHEVFESLAERHGVEPRQRHFIEGTPLNSICTFAADHQIDVIVMGTTEHRGLDRRLGTTAELILQRAPCSVLAIKPQE